MTGSPVAPGVTVDVSTSTPAATPVEVIETVVPAPATPSSDTTGTMVELAQQITRMEGEVAALRAELAARPDPATADQLAQALARIAELEAPAEEVAEVIEVAPVPPLDQQPAPIAEPQPGQRKAAKKSGFLEMF
jgi:hypothetical protein